MTSIDLKICPLTKEYGGCIGNKARGLLRVAEAGYRIPRSMVLSTSGPGTTEWAAVLKSNFADVRLFAIRSSSSVEDGRYSWAGQFDSLLNQKFEDIPAAVEKVLKSQSSSRVISYANAVGVEPAAIQMAVLVQEMIQPLYSGVAFSKDPTLPSESDLVLIEVITGDGHALVSGKVSPGRYRFNRRTRTVECVGVNVDIPSSDLIRIGMMAVGLEDVFATGVDVEWALDNSNEIIVLQCREIEVGVSNYYLKYSDFEDQFKCTSLPCYLADILMLAYRRLGHVFSFDRAGFVQHAAKNSLRETSAEGVALISDMERLTEHVAQSKLIAQNIHERISSVSIDALSGTDIMSICEEMSVLILRYSKFDSIYVDEAVRQSTGTGHLAEGLRYVGATKDNIRVAINGLMVDDGNALQQMVRTIGDRRGLSHSDGEWLTVPELLNETLSSQRLAELRDQRRVAYVVVGAGHDHRWIQGAEAIPLIRQIRFTPPIDTPILRGAVACRGEGNVSGIVKIVKVDLNDVRSIYDAIHSMPEGVILVAETTSPELSEAFGKAKAIITDIGGLLSHAAIVSRTFNLPCIVGTGNATKMLRDGMHVTMDVDVGNVYF